MDLVLYHYWRSSSSWRVRWALAYKEIPYRANAINLLEGEQTREDFKVHSPLGVVPCLVIDGRALTESVAIFEWLEETVPDPPLFPGDRWLRARTRQLVELVNSGIQPVQNLTVLQHLSPETSVRKEWARHWIERGLVAIERELEVVAREVGNGQHAVGDAITAADLFIAPQVYNARRFGVDLSQLPRVVAVEGAALPSEAARRSHPDVFSPDQP
jgi:maleylacetoacetate isomerase